MKNLKLWSVVALTGIMLTFSCDKDDPVPTLPYEEVFGSWEWYSTTNGLTQVTTYADSVDYAQTLEISEQGDYLWKKDTAIVSDATFTIEIDTIEGDETYFLVFNDTAQVDQTFKVQNQDTLYLNDQCDDCDSHLFIRR